MRVAVKGRVEEKILLARTEIKVSLEEGLQRLRADSAEKLSQQLGAERERLRMQLTASKSPTLAQL